MRSRQPKLSARKGHRRSAGLAAWSLLWFVASAANAQSIGDRVWYDVDADGIQDAGEPGIHGAVIDLRTGSGGYVSSSTTDASGAYSFAGVASGTYYLELRGGSCLGVTLSPQDQGSDDELDSDFAPATYRTVNFTFSGDNAGGYDLGIVTQPATVSGTVWFETDFDGLREAGELGVSGVTVYLYSQDCVGFWFYRSTDANGDFAFTNFLPATSPTRRFRLHFSRPGDRFFTKQDQGGDDAVDSDIDPTGYSADIAVLPGDSLTGIDAGLVATSVGTVTIGDGAWSDLDADGLQDAGEPGLGAVPIRLWGGNGAGVISDSGTGPSGSYSFANLPPGKYLLEYPSASCFGATVSPKDQGADDTLDSDFNPPSGSSRTDPFDVYAGADGSRDLGLIGATSSLSGRVFFDADGDGVRDPGEPGIAGVTVTIDTPCWGGIRSVATDGNGEYAFPVILSRPSTGQDYRVLFTLPSGYYYTQQDQGGDDTTDSDADTAGYTSYFDAPPGGAVTDVDAGLVPSTIGTVRIGDRAWYDADGDGLQDPGEPGMTGPGLRLESANGGYLGERYPDVDGWYEFSGTSPGFHRIRHYGPSCLGVTLSPFDVGGDDGVDSDFQSGLLGTPLFSAGVGLNHQWDLGITSLPASVAGRVWQDLDADGVQDIGESGVGGYPVTLYFWSCGGSVTVYTQDDGSYSFPSVMPTTVSRQYRIIVGWSGNFGFSGFSPIDQGSDDTLDSDVDASGYSVPFSLLPGSTVANLDAGLLGGTLRTVGDLVWQDQDADGVQDAGESGVDGVVVRLLAPDARSIAETMTSGGGAYAFGGLALQTYAVEFQLPSGFAFTLKDQGSDASDSDADPSTGRTASFYLSATSDTSRDAGVVPADPASVGDRVWLDLDGDGVQDAGEGGVANVTVTLYTAGGAQVSQTTTSASGGYAFDNLLPGDYKLVFSLPSGFLFSPQDQGGDDALDSDASPASGETAVFTLVSGGSDPSRDAGLIPDALATVGDYVWDDLDRDGVQDAGEPGLEGISVELFTSGGAPVGSTTTNASGIYSFSGLASGDYYIEFTLPALYQFSAANQTSDALDSDADPGTGRSHTFNLSLGEDETSIDAGMSLADSTPPSVVNVDSVASSGGSIDEGEVANVAITVLLVTFDEAMDEILAETLGNYILVEAGPNETLETTGCALGGDDAPVAIDSATYVLSTATLGLNGGAALAEGSYALVACAALEDGAGNALDGDGDGGGGDDFVRTFTVDQTAPRVDSVDSFFDTGDGILGEGEATNVAITRLMVAFDEPVADPTGDTEGDDVTNPANWLLLETGADSTFDTVDCATGADLDDVALAVDAVAYDEPTRTATLDVNAGTPLSDGLYRLVACGTTSIVDLGGNPLDGDGDATGGDDFSRTFRVDTVGPDEPSSVESISHVSGGWVTATPVAMAWSGASDAAAGVAGYSVLFDDQPSAQPDASIDVAQSNDPHGVTSPPLGEGAWYFHLVTCDLAGNCTEPVHRGPYGIDTTAPSAPDMATSASHGDGLPKSDATIDVAWGAATDVLSGIDGYSFFFDGNAVSACETTKDVEEGTLSATSAALADGTWYAHVCAVDNAGNWGAVVHGGPYVVDTAAPTGLAASSSSHAVSTWSNDTTVDFGFSGAADANGIAGYSLAFDQAAGTDPDTTVDQAGTSYTGTASTDASDWYLHVRACDSAGNCGTTVHAGPYWIDATAPSDPGAVTSSSHDSGPTNDDTIEAEWGAASDATSGVASYRYAFATNAFGSPTCADLGEATAATSATSSALAEGTWYLHVCAEDGAGNRSGVATGGPYVIDATSPQVANVDSVASAGGSLEEGEVTNVTITELLVAFDETMDETLAETPGNYLLVEAGPNTTLDTTGCTLGGDDVPVAIDAADYAAGAATLGVNGGAALADGHYALVACAALQDVAGNALDGDGDATGGDDFVRTFEIDTASPAVVASRIADDGQPLTGGLQTNATVTGIEVDFDERMADPPGDGGAGDVDSPSSYRLVFDLVGAFETDTCDDADPGDDVDVAIDAVSWNEGALRATTAVNGGVALGDGWYRFFACAALADRAGNALAAELNVDFRVDTQAPTLPSTLSSTTHVEYVWSGIETLGMLWSGAADEATGSGLSHYELSVDALPAGVPDGSWTLPHATDPHEVSAGPLGAGVWYFHLVACDAAGNCAGPHHAGPYLVDFTGPLPPLSVVSPSHDAGPSQDPTIDVTWPPAIDDASGLAGYAWHFSATSSWSCDEVEDGDETSSSTTSPVLGEGAWYFHLCAVDNAGNWGSAGSYGPWTIDLTGPTITGVDSVAAADWTQPGPAVVESALTQVLVAFDEEMATAGGGSVLEGGNWLLVEAGANLALETADCSGASGDDLPQPLAGFQYDAGLGVAALAVGSGSGLSAGSYRLLACPTLTDVAGNGLDGAGDGGGSEAFARDFVVTQSRHLANPNFDGGLDGWLLSGPVPEEWSLGAEDAEGRPFSGAAKLETTAGSGGVWSLEQCVDTIEPGAQGVSALVRTGSAEPGAPSVRAFLTWADAPGCGGNWVALGASAPLAGGSGGAWRRLAVPPVAPPPGAVGFWLSFEVTGGTAESFTVEIDRSLYPDAWSIFDDGFESGDTCAWSGTEGGPVCP